MRPENQIDYLEIPVNDPAKAREFFEAMFGWKFQEWGPDYLSFSDGRFDGGICRSAEPGQVSAFILLTRPATNTQSGQNSPKTKNNGAPTCMN